MYLFQFAMVIKFAQCIRAETKFTRCTEHRINEYIVDERKVHQTEKK